jgi:hypothetical protein
MIMTIDTTQGYIAPNSPLAALNERLQRDRLTMMVVGGFFGISGVALVVMGLAPAHFENMIGSEDPAKRIIIGLAFIASVWGMRWIAKRHVNQLRVALVSGKTLKCSVKLSKKREWQRQGKRNTYKLIYIAELEHEGKTEYFEVSRVSAKCMEMMGMHPVACTAYIHHASGQIELIHAPQEMLIVQRVRLTA